MIPLVMAAGAAIQLGGSIAKGIKGAQQASRMRDAIANYDRQPLENAYRGKVAVSTLGADLQTEEAGRMASTSMDALQSGGVRGIVGGMGRWSANNNAVFREIGAGLDKQQKSIDFAAAQDDTRIRQLQEQRERDDLAGMGRAMEAGRQDMWSGIGELGTGLMSMGAGLDMPKGAGLEQVASVGGLGTSPVKSLSGGLSGISAPLFNR